MEHYGGGVQESLLWCWHLKDNKQDMSEDTSSSQRDRKLESSTLKPKLRSSLMCCIFFFSPFCIHPSLLCQSNHLGGHHYFTVWKREDYNICQLCPLLPSTSFHFSFFFSFVRQIFTFEELTDVSLHRPALLLTDAIMQIVSHWK